MLVFNILEIDYILLSKSTLCYFSSTRQIGLSLPIPAKDIVAILLKISPHGFIFSLTNLLFSNPILINLLIYCCIFYFVIRRLIIWLHFLVFHYFHQYWQKMTHFYNYMFQLKTTPSLPLKLSISSVILVRSYMERCTFSYF